LRAVEPPFRKAAETLEASQRTRNGQKMRILYKNFSKTKEKGIFAP
jgi:hypothetical protein